MKKNKVTIFILLTIIFLFLAFFIWQGIYLPKNSSLKKKNLFLIEKGEGFRKIAKNLEKEGIIKNKFFFEGYIFLKRKGTHLQAGGYLLSPSMSVSEIAEKIISGKTSQIQILIPEGLSIKQIGERLVSREVLKKDLLSLKVGDFKKEFWFLNKVSPTNSLEGFLFPDTYYFAYGLAPEEVARKMLKNFEKKFDLGLREEIERQGKSVFEIVIMASLLEKEVRTFEDKKMVSGILWKRLQNHFPLQVDATITYLTGKKTTNISQHDLQIDSPYNTYKYLGLPPGPICNPGLESIEAAIYPKESDFWYYLSKPDGETAFSKTLDEHNIKKAKYLR